MKFFIAIASFVLLATLVNCEAPVMNKRSCGGIGDELSAQETADVVQVWSANRHLLKDCKGNKISLK